MKFIRTFLTEQGEQEPANVSVNVPMLCMGMVLVIFLVGYGFYQYW